MEKYKHIGKKITFLILFCISDYSSATNQINGVVTGVGVDIVTIKNIQSVIPEIGNSIEIYFKVNNEEILAGSARVINVNGSIISGKIISSEVPILENMIVIIHPNSQASQFSPNYTGNTNYNSDESNINNKYINVYDYRSLPSDNSAINKEITGSQNGWTEKTYEVNMDNGNDISQENISNTPAGIRYEKSELHASSDTISLTRKSLSETDIHKILQINLYELVWNDSGSGANKDFATFRPVSIDGYYALGDVAVSEPWKKERYNPPEYNTLLIKDGAIDLKKPIDYVKVWDSHGSKSDTPFSTWMPIASPGYKCLGEVGSQSFDKKPSLNIIRCLPDRCVIKTKAGKRIWADKGSGADMDYSAWQVPEVNLYVGHASHKKLKDDIYTINNECL